MFKVYRGTRYIKSVKRNFDTRNYAIRRETTILKKKLILNYRANIEVYIARNIIVLRVL
jgi:hypothetical protein